MSFFDGIKEVFIGGNKDNTQRLIPWVGRPNLDQNNINKMARLILKNYINDVTAQIKANNPLLNQSLVHSSDIANLAHTAISINDILMDYYLENRETTFYYVSYGSVKFLSKQNSFKETGFTVLQELHLSSFSKDNAFYDILLQIVAVINNITSTLADHTSIKAKPILKVKGLTALLGGNKTDGIEFNQQYQDYLQGVLDQQAQSIFNGEYAVIDSESTIEVVNVELNGLQEKLAVLGNLLSLFLQIPQSKLFGLAPQGLNATGEYDDINYQKRIERDVQLLSRFLEQIKEQFSVTTPIYYDRIEKLLNLLNLTDETLALQGYPLEHIKERLTEEIQKAL